MPNCQIKIKAGKFYFLLVCLILCTACGRKKAVFETGNTSAAVTEAEKIPEELPEETKSKEITQTEEPVAEEENGLVNINEADAAQLMTLPGIGQTRAEAIIEYRRQTGAFKTIEEIMNVKGIKTGVFSKLSKLICVK